MPSPLSRRWTSTGYLALGPTYERLTGNPIHASLSMNKLHRRWMDLASRLGIPVSMAETVFSQIENQYSIPRRAYHNLDHIARCLGDFDALRGECENPEAVEAAIWFHDAVYDTHRKDNEERSAELAERTFRELGQAEGFVDSVVALIRVTCHDRPARTPDEAAIVDVDLAGLGASPARFNRDGHAIHEEYGWVSEEEYRKARAVILQQFLDRPTIYHTALFRERCEEQARRNLRRALKRLTSPPK